MQVALTKLQYFCIWQYDNSCLWVRTEIVDFTLICFAEGTMTITGYGVTEDYLLMIINTYPSLSENRTAISLEI